METVLYAKNIQDLLAQLKNNMNLTVVGGCTKIEALPQKIISVWGIPELSQISRHERYFNVGPGTTLNDLLAIGQNHLPQILHEALLSIANPMIRNMATIGGNICSPGHKLTLFAPLMALEAKLEFKNQTETKLEPIQSFKKVPEGFILSNIRIPYTNPEISIFRKIGQEEKINEQSASFAFLADTENNALIDVKLAFAGPFVFKSKSLENSLIGHRLPFSKKEIDELQERIASEFEIAATDQMLSNVLKQQFLNLTRYSLEQLT